MAHNLIKGYMKVGILTGITLFGLVTAPEANTPVYQEKTGKSIHYNWGQGSPPGMPVNYFSAIFDQSNTFSAGNYFIQALADDGVKVEADGKMLIDRWSHYTGKADRALWLGVTEGQHNVKTHYLENVYGAAILSDIVPLDSWLAYYYPNKELSGMPAASKIIPPTGSFKTLSQDFGTGSPAPGVGSDRFSAKYTTAKRLAAGEYIVRAKADDGVRVYVDGKLYVDRWTDGGLREDAIKINIADRPGVPEGEKDIHWIDVEYYDLAAAGKVEVGIEPFHEAVKDQWVGEIFPNQNLQGTPYIIGGSDSLNPISKIDYQWGDSGSPHPSVPGNRFSARFTKKVNMDAGTYVFKANADDGVRVYLDNQLVIDAWPNVGFNQRSQSVNVAAGEHTIRVEYLEDSFRAFLNFDYEPITQFVEKTGKSVFYNWGSGSPRSGVPSDYFSAIFDQSNTFSAGNYFIQALADDGVKVEADGKMLIDRWSHYTGKADRALWLGVTEGQHNVKTHYLENVYGAAILSDIVPLDSWLAYYYPNKELSGMPAASKIIPPTGSFKTLSQDFGTGSPAPGVGSDRFSAKYTTAKRLAAGEYIVRAKADDGVRVYVDGKLYVDRWTDGGLREDAIKINIADRPGVPEGEKDIHWIDVEYYDLAAAGKVEVGIEPFHEAVKDQWVGEIFPNQNLQGTPYIIGGSDSLNPISKIDYQWGDSGSPHPSVPGNRFSARFTKKVNMDAGTYVFKANADDGVRVYLDNQLVIDAWPNVGFNQRSQSVNVVAGEHTIRVEYLEDAARAYLNFDFQPIAQFSEKTGKSVFYNWGSGSPRSGIPSDFFSAIFDQSNSFSAGDYFIQALADDGVKVEVDGNMLIDRWSHYTGKADRTLWLGVTEGQHTVKTHYLENVFGAAILSDIVPLDSWLAYYYPNKELSGMPAASKIISPTGSLKTLYQDFGTGSPAPGVGSDNFSAKYTTAKRVTAGEYILRAKADDGIRVYVDGKLYVDRWTNSGFREDSIKINIADRPGVPEGEKDIHWIDVEYYDLAAEGKVEVGLEPFHEAVMDQWVGEIFPNQNFQGTPYIIGGSNSLSPIAKIDYQWGNAGSPHSLVAGDNFSARFTKKLNMEAGTYAFRANADDGIRVKLDNQVIIDNWSFAPQGAGIYLPGGEHTLTVEYIEISGNAFAKLDIEKLSPNKIFYQFGKNVQYNWGLSGPATFPTDHFEAVFDQSQNVQAGDHFIQTFADDGVQVEIDGQMFINRWTDYIGTADRALWLGASSGSHTIKTRYYDNVLEAGVFSHIVPFDKWLAYYYPNKTLNGFPVAAKVLEPVGDSKRLSESHQASSPVPEVGADNFSVRYTTAKRLDAGYYSLRTRADDGIRVYVDGVLVLDRWTGGVKEDSIRLKITDRLNVAVSEKNVHWIDVEYYDDIAAGHIELSIDKQPGPIYLTTHYNYTFSQAVDKQMSVVPQTDLHSKYLRSDSLVKDDKGTWRVNGSGWNVRNGPGTSYNIVGTMVHWAPASILRTVPVTGDLNWYQIAAWMIPLRNDVEYYMNPANFAKESTQYFQFLKLSESAGLDVNEVNSKILNGKGILQGKASAFAEAGRTYGINEVYLISHALLETGDGKSELATGVRVTKVDGKDVEPKTVYNMYGIKALDSCPLECGSEYAYKMGWTTPELAIKGGAKFIAEQYIDVGQDTLYKMRWNPSAPGTHQYATDIGWAVKQVYRIKSLYDLLSNYTLIFDEPVYK